jgi:pyruvate kinase
MAHALPLQLADCEEVFQQRASPPMSNHSKPRDLSNLPEASLLELIDELKAIRGELTAIEQTFAEELAQVDESFRKSATNLLHYLALRSRDIRVLQDRLAALGLSSIGRAEAHVMATVTSVLAILGRLANVSEVTLPPLSTMVEYGEGRRLLQLHTENLLGARPANRFVRIMVTMDTGAADDYLLVRETLARGMDCMRINCAHDRAPVWLRMIEHLDRARRELGRPCCVLMDLGGPKLRTGPVAPGPAVVSWRPRRNAVGEVIAAARVCLVPRESVGAPTGAVDAVLPVPAEWLARIEVGDRIRLHDARGKARTLKVVGAAGEVRSAECGQTAFVVPGLPLSRVSAAGAVEAASEVGPLAATDQAIVLFKGDVIVLTSEQLAGRNAVRDSAGSVLSPATIACTLPEIFMQVHPGERIWFDDGKIAGVIRQVSREHIHIEITGAKPNGSKLRGDKGINLPDSQIHLPALTAKDLEDLEFVVQHANLVGMSFVRHERDIQELRSHLSRLHGEHLGIVLKIETRQGFERLPNLMLAVMRHRSAGAMIARGDLAVECGYERMAEVQEEILWLCEAAHMPVIWATQVLESLARKGQPSRAEITDAAMGERAECVMLNKGPHIVEAISTLDDILHRMQAHQAKKSSRLRPLHLRAMRERSD